MRGWATAAVLCAILAAAPARAEACPSCAGNARGGVGRIVALGLMIVFPFALAAAVVPVIRRGPADPRG